MRESTRVGLIGRAASLAVLALMTVMVGRASAQAPEVVFEDDFSSGEINPGKFQPGAPFFEGGVGDIHAETSDGVLRFVGTTTQQWWSGGTLQVVPTFTATPETPVTFEVDRVSAEGVGTSERSAVWILDETQDNYVLFADNRGENGWQFNRKIGEDGDAPTGGGSNIAAFDDAGFNDGGLHRMRIVANGETVKLFLDDQEGAEVRFPFSEIVFHVGAYARANNDTANTTFDNLSVQTIVPAGNLLFSDDFSSDTIDPGRYEAATPFFEGGVGDIHAEAGGGVMRFVGSTTQQWWSGGTLRVAQTFEPSDSEKVTISIDRVAEEGTGTANRSALWIMDEAESNYVLFAENRGENGWQFNRKIGEDGDSPTGGGSNIAAFDGDPFDDGLLHRMKMEADGETVKLYLDDILGAEVRFPFSPVVFHFGAFARANGDVANTTWDNLLIESEGGATFEPSQIGVLKGQETQDIVVRIPQGLNASRAVELSVVSADPTVAHPAGAPDGTLTLTYPAGGGNTATFRVMGVEFGGVEFTIQGDINVGNRLSVAVLSDPGVILEDDFSGAAIDSSKWSISDVPFGTGSGGNFTVSQTGGELLISGDFNGGTSDWVGASVKTVDTFIASRELNLSVEVDRVAVVQGVGTRTGVFITNDDRSQYVFFSHNSGGVAADTPLGNDWQVNVNPGSATGDGIVIPEFIQFSDLGRHHMRMVANGEEVEVFLDGVSGGTYPFAVNSGIHVEIGAYTELADLDLVDGTFDNLKIETVFPCVSPDPASSVITIADKLDVSVSVPQLLRTEDVSVTVTSSNPDVAVPSGGSNGVLVLNFPAGESAPVTFKVLPIGLGSVSFDMTADVDVCVESLPIEVVSYPETFLTDDFSGGNIDDAIWSLDMTPFDSGTTTAESGVTIQDGQAVISVTVAEPLFPGIALMTQQAYSATATEPLTFEIDRSDLDFVLTTGTGTEVRTGIWVKDGNGNFVFFNEYKAFDGRSFGWRFNKVAGADDDNPTNSGVNLPAFDGGGFDDGGSHRLKIVVNGTDVKLFIDDVFGGSVAFPFSQGLRFGFGAYADELGNVAIGTFDNALILGGAGDPPVGSDPATLSISVDAGTVEITWDEDGTLQSTTSLAPPVQWTDVDPAPVGNSLSVPVGEVTAVYYRVVN